MTTFSALHILSSHHRKQLYAQLLLFLHLLEVPAVTAHVVDVLLRMLVEQPLDEFGYSTAFTFR